MPITNRLAGVNQPHFQRHSLRRQRLHVRLVLRERLLRRHLRHQPHRYLRRRLGGNHRLRACAGKSARHAVHIERRPRPRPLQHRVARLARQHRRAHLGLAVMLFVERQLLPRRQSRRRRRRHVVVEAGNQNLPLASFSCAMICASATNGFGAAPPYIPECRSVFAPRASISV